jgi:hypothetical protein
MSTQHEKSIRRSPSGINASYRGFGDGSGFAVLGSQMG